MDKMHLSIKAASSLQTKSRLDRDKIKEILAKFPKQEQRLSLLRKVSLVNLH